MLDADRRASVARRDLYEVARLVGEPQPTPALGLEVGAAAAGEGIADHAAITDFDHDGRVRDSAACRGPRPPAQHPASPAVIDAVGGQLVDREHQVVGAKPVEARAGRQRSHPRAPLPCRRP